MSTIIGYLIVTASVVGGYLLEGGKLGVLLQPVELLIIFGAAIGSLIAASSPHLIKAILHEILGIIKGSGVSKDKYMQGLKLMYELFKIAAGNPIAIEAHVDKPETSEVFKKYPLIAHDHHAMEFICNTLLLQVSSNIPPHDLEDLMDNDIQTIHDEENEIPKTISRISDALPGLGIVAAVLGIVITMGKLTMGKEVIGHSVAAALVGTFLGILLSYGFFQPLAARLEGILGEKGKVLIVLKCGLLAYAKGSNAKTCIEFARRSIPLEYRPSFSELDKAMSSAAAAKAA